MKKILVTRKLLKESEDKALKIFESKLNSNDELYSCLLYTSDAADEP